MKTLLTKLKTLAVMFVAAVIGFAGTAFAVSTPTPPGGVTIESSLAVANATDKTAYKSSVNAGLDDVVNIQVWYHNPNPENSDKIAKDVRVKIDMPTGKNTTHAITSVVGGSNTNTETLTAAVNTSISAQLDYIEGSAVRRYNTGTNANPNWVNQKISDSVVGSGYVVPTFRPCWNFAETITIQARVTAPVLKITKQVKIEGTDGWHTTIDANRGDKVAYLITLTNQGNEALTNVSLKDNLPPRMTYVPGSAKLYSVNYPNGRATSDNLVAGGVNYGTLQPDSNLLVRFNAIVTGDPEYCGATRFTNVATTRSDQTGDIYNTAIVSIPRVCTTSEELQLRIVKFHDRDGDKIQDSNEERLSGWRFRVTGPNGFKTTTVTDSNGTAIIAGDLDEGRYVVTEVLQSGWTNTTGLSIERTVTEDPSTQTFVFGNRKVSKPPVTPPGGGETGKGQPLPASGPMESAAAAAGTLGLSGSAVAWIRSKKRLLDSFRK